MHGCPPPLRRGRKFGFTQSYGRSYGGIAPVFIEFHWPPQGPFANTVILNIASPLQMGRTFSQRLRSLKGTQGYFLCGFYTVFNK